VIDCLDAWDGYTQGHEILLRRMGWIHTRTRNEHQIGNIKHTIRPLDIMLRVDLWAPSLLSTSDTCPMLHTGVSQKPSL